MLSLNAIAIHYNESTRLVADSLVEADLWGHASHGVLRLSWYVDRLRTGAMRPVTAPELVHDGGAIAVLDGRDGIGQVVASEACSDAVQRARRHGAGVVGVRNSNHFGTAAYFTRRMARQGCVGILTTNSSPAMAPWGGRDKLIGANPWSIAAPAGRHGVAVVDIANTSVARGKIYAARERGTLIPAGWALDADGEPTTDPGAALAGAILPMAAHKGYAIAFMIDVLSGVLTGSAFAAAVNGPYQASERSGCGHLAIALDVDAFIGRDAFGHRMEELIAGTKAASPARGGDEVFYPGEPEDRAKAARERGGLALPAATTDALRRLAEESGVRFRLQ